MFAVDGILTVCEIKADASSVEAQTVIRLMELADRIGTKPLLAAPAGDWDISVTELCAERGVALLGAAELLTAADHLRVNDQ